ncbi:MAG: carboxylating nicotinate-nucleotide diphosphorylase, partial [Myxococcota bacterium]
MLIAPPNLAIENVVRLALEEDIARGDLTSDALIPKDQPGKADVRARDALTLSGLPVITAVYARVDAGVRVTPRVEDGADLKTGDVAATLEGPARALLLGERVALNFAQRLSGIATMARHYTSLIPEGCGCRIADTRKTTPGLRALERYAVRCGGAHNHRNDLSSAVMIKDNHIAACGGDVRVAIERARAHAPHTSRIECEVDTLEQLEVAVEAGADVVMLDNFSDEETARGVAYVRDHQMRPTIVEASGGITFERIPALARAG